MKRILLVLGMFITISAQAGDAGGNGGDVYVDEFKAYRSWLVRILKGEHSRLEKDFGFTPEQYANALNRFEKVHLIRKGRSDVTVSRGGQDVLAPSILPDTLENLFRIDGEPKMAVSITIDGVDLTFFDETEWDKLSGKTLRKLKLVGHELFTFVGLEKTGDNRYTQHFDDGLVRRYPFSNDGGMPMVPIWSIPFRTDIQINMNETCQSAGPQATLKRLIGDPCKAQLPKEVPSPYFAYECLFDGDMTTPVKERYETTHYTTTGYIPGSFSSFSSRGSESYYNNTLGSVTSFSRSWNRHGHGYKPGYRIQEDTIITRPVWQKFCRIDGTLTLLGVDPMTEDRELKLLKTSKDVSVFNEALIAERDDAAEYCRSQCFEYRKRLPKGLVNESKCRMMQDENNHYRWELWGVFPYRSQPQLDQ